MANMYHAFASSSHTTERLRLLEQDAPSQTFMPVANMPKH